MKKKNQKYKEIIYKILKIHITYVPIIPDK